MNQSTTTDPAAIARIVKLRYVKASMPGYSRIKKGKYFQYVDQQGERIVDKNILERINKLVLPPAWEKVWICPFENGHLQATGIDAMGRKQYRYHMLWNKISNETKYGRLLHFGERLPRIRKNIKADLNRKILDKERVMIIALSVMQ